MAHKKNDIDLMMSVVNGVLTAMKYPAGSVAQQRCFEEVAQDAKIVVDRYHSAVQIDVGDRRILKYDTQAFLPSGEEVVVLAGDMIVATDVLPFDVRAYNATCGVDILVSKASWLQMMIPKRSSTPTPGDWLAKEDGCVVAAHDSLDEVVCSCTGRAIDPSFFSEVPGRAEANAEFIASGPRMLMALLAVVQRDPGAVELAEKAIAAAIGV